MGYQPRHLPTKFSHRNSEYNPSQFGVIVVLARKCASATPSDSRQRREVEADMDGYKNLSSAFQRSKCRSAQIWSIFPKVSQKVCWSNWKKTQVGQTLWYQPRATTGLTHQVDVFIKQAVQAQAFSLELALFLGSRTAWMLGRTPPWAIVTPARSLFNSSSFLHGTVRELLKRRWTLNRLTW